MTNVTCNTDYDWVGAESQKSPKSWTQNAFKLQLYIRIFQKLAFVKILQNLKGYSRYLPFFVSVLSISYFQRELSASWSLPKHLWGVLSVCHVQTFFECLLRANLLLWPKALRRWQLLINMRANLSCSWVSLRSTCWLWQEELFTLPVCAFSQ